MTGWTAVGFALEAAFPYQEWREAPWLHGVIGDDDAPARPRIFEKIEAPHVQRIETAIEQWLSGTAPDQLEHPASYFLALRFSTVAHLLMSFDGVFPHPTETATPDIYRKFLLSWWRRNGSVYGVGFSCSDYEHNG